MYSPEQKPIINNVGDYQFPDGIVVKLSKINTKILSIPALERKLHAESFGRSLEEVTADIIHDQIVDLLKSDNKTTQEKRAVREAVREKEIQEIEKMLKSGFLLVFDTKQGCIIPMPELTSRQIAEVSSLRYDKEPLSSCRINKNILIIWIK